MSFAAFLCTAFAIIWGACFVYLIAVAVFMRRDTREGAMTIFVLLICLFGILTAAASYAALVLA
ncbi:hypothetical protein ACN2XU_02605 [Primorskyibacter sp. 2E107]|uniref:hypothetical protein n=1 Tax=Primorskyibacter sp. 2E107 TaxID=3403458 RepID=UPI003AF88967